MSNILLWENVPETQRYPLDLLEKLLRHAKREAKKPQDHYWHERVKSIANRFDRCRNPQCQAAAKCGDTGYLQSGPATGMNLRGLYLPCLAPIAPGAEFCFRHGGPPMPRKKPNSETLSRRRASINNSLVRLRWRIGNLTDRLAIARAQEQMLIAKLDALTDRQDNS